MAKQSETLFTCRRRFSSYAAGRADLLVASAGRILGSYLASAGTTYPRKMYAVALLIAAGADVDTVVHIDRTRATTAVGSRPRPQLPPTITAS